MSPSLTTSGSATSGAYSVALTYDGAGCNTATLATTSYTLNNQPSVSALTSNATNPLCSGGAMTLTATTAGGAGAATYTWSGPDVTTVTGSSNVSPSLVTSGTAASGTYSVTLAYAGTGCTTTSPFESASYTINDQPSVSALSSSASNPFCVGGVMTLTATSAGGAGTARYTWSGPRISTVTGSSNVSPSLTTSGGTASGAYSVTLAYSGTGCTTTAPVATAVYTLNAQPSVSGVSSNASNPLCVGGVMTLTATTAGGAGNPTYTWSGPDVTTVTGSASVSPSLTTSGSAATGAYSVSLAYDGTGCNTAAAATASYTLNNQPSVSALISNATNPLCLGGVMTLTATAAGGAGAPTYTWSGPDVTTVTGSSNVSPSLTTSGSATSGTYSVTLAYAGTGCVTTPVFESATYTITAQPSVTALSSSSSNPFCSGGVVTLTATSGGGAGSPTYTWRGPGISTTTGSSNVSPSFTTSGGAVAAAYSVSLAYDGTGCITAPFASAVYTMTAQPSISVVTSSPTNTNICTTGVITLTATPSGGAGTATYTWSGPGISSTTSGISTSPALSPASVSPVSGAYSVSLSYDGTGCNVANNATTSTYTVSPQPTVASITGLPSSVCTGSALTLTAGAVTGPGTVTYHWAGPDGYASAGGTNTAVFSPSVTALSGTYSVYVTYPGTGCTSTVVATSTAVTVNPIPTTIHGTKVVCVAASTTLSDDFPGGSWSSSNSNGSVDATTGVVTGLTAGTVVITYKFPGGCYITATVTVNSLPAVINGSSTVCTGSTTSLTDATSGGVWSSTNPSLATIGSASHIVTGIAPGLDTIIFKLTTTGCARTYSLTVNAITPVTGNTGAICPGSSLVTLSDATGTGTWTSGTPAKATVGSASGTVTGVAAGTSIITYVVTATGCKATTVVSVNAMTAIAGASVVCTGSTITLSDATAGGVWSYTGSGVAALGTSGSPVTLTADVSSGTATVSYTLLSTGCAAGKVITVNQSPTIGSVSGISRVCVGSTTTLTDDIAGGTWSSSTAKATIGTAGIASGVSAGSSTITYLLSTGCKATTQLTVNPITAILGTAKVCSGGATTSLSDATAGGAWTSSAPSTGSVGTSGIVSGGSVAGVTTISYTIAATGCAAGVVVTVNQSPTIGSASGMNSVCVGSTTTLTDDISGGTWSSSTAKATIGTAGIVTGAAAGSTTISYTIANGCKASLGMSVNAFPAAIAGSNHVCEGNMTLLSDGSAGGSWSATGDAGVDGSGNVTGGLVAGTATVQYTLGGCTVSKIVSVNPLPDPITGVGTVCAGGTLMLSDDVSGGTWSSSSTAVATIGSTSGVLTAVAGGSTTVTYTTGTGCFTTTSVAVNTILPITGNVNLCVSGTTTLSDASAGGTWSSPDGSGVISLGTMANVVTAVGTGTATVVYTVSGGCSRSTVITVNNPPMPISGNLTVCMGASTTLSDIGTGTWSSSNNAVASVGSSTGIVTTSAYSGTVGITYTAGPGCSIGATLTINPNPTLISGPSSGCMGTSFTLIDTTGGGTWSSSNTAVGTIDPSSGTVYGVSAGNATISYTVNGCFRTYNININPLPSGITGLTTVCQGGTTTLSDATGGGISYTSSDPATASVSGNVVTGVNPGAAVITYMISTGCTTTTTVTVIPANAGITLTGAASTCSGGTISLSDASGTGTWTSSNTSVATVGTDGTVSGIGNGTATIYYVQSGVSGCTASQVISVNPVVAITGTASFCSGGSTLLHNTVSGGVWSTSSSIVSVGSSSGLVTGTSTVTATGTIVYTTGGGCTSSVDVTVNALPVISGTASICVGGTAGLTGTPSGGAWGSSNVGAITVDGSGNITGVAAGHSVISYTSLSGCLATTYATVNVTPVAITGSTSVCTGSTVTLADGTAGGTWSVVSPDAGTVDGSGHVYGVAPGVATVNYTIGGTCTASYSVTVNTAPGALSGPTGICAGYTITLSESSAGGVWSSSNSNATVDGSGNVTGAVDVTGSAVISYTLADGCYSTYAVNVAILPSAITGTPIVCTGLTTTLSDIPTGGTWSTTSSLLTIGSASGLVSAGGMAGTATIYYSVGTGCSDSVTVTVNALPGTITGNWQVCQGSTTTLSDAGGGTWSSSNIAEATVGSSTGVVTPGPYTGTVTITYTLPTSCIATAVVTVNAAPTLISGPSSVCVGSAITMIDTTSGGTWSTSNSSVGTVDPVSGIITGIGTGSMSVYYTNANNCARSYAITVNSVPLPINAGSGQICQGGTLALSDATTGAVGWTSGSVGTATVTGGGLVTGVSAGTANITYKISTGCTAVTTVTVNAVPGSIGGNAAFCAGTTLTLTDAVGGGVWSSSNAATGTIDAASGTVTGIAGGTTVITYMNGTCPVTTIVTVNAILPITGSSSVCNGSTITLTDGTSGGRWSSSVPATASVGSTNGVVTGASLGTTVITYTGANTCIRTQTVTVTNGVGPITGTTNVCAGYTTTLNAAVGGGTWTSGNVAEATVGSSSGIVTGSSSYTGTVTITYSTGTGCTVSTPVTINPNPAGITGPSVARGCVGATFALSDVSSGGTWVSSNSAIGSVSSVTGTSATIMGVSVGSVTISYVLGTGCYKNYATFTINPVPLPINAGTGLVCVGGTASLSDATGGASGWSSSSTAVATVSGGGLVTGVSAGTVNITYTITTGCYISTQETINPTPTVTAIQGATSISHATPATLSDATPGGVWSTSNTAKYSFTGTGSVVTVNALTTSGSAVIYYTITNGFGCSAVASRTETSSARYAQGSQTSVYAGSTVSIVDEVITGLWSSSDNSIATVDANGAVTGIRPGSVDITHDMANDGGSITTIVTPVVVSAVPANLSIAPNPNKGTFTVKGTLGTVSDEQATLEVTDVLGQVLYTSKVQSHGGRINETVTLANNLANGMYMLSISSNTEKKVFHFVIEQ